MCLEINYGLMCFFKNSNYLMNQIAHSFYNNQGNKKTLLKNKYKTYIN